MCAFFLGIIWWCWISVSQLYVYKSGTCPYWSLLLHRSYHNDWSEGFLNEHLMLHIFLTVSHLRFTFLLRRHFTAPMKRVSQAVKLLYILQVSLEIWPIFDMSPQTLWYFYNFFSRSVQSGRPWSKDDRFSICGYLYLTSLPLPHAYMESVRHRRDQASVKTDTVLIKIRHTIKERAEVEVRCKVAGSAQQPWEG